MPHLEQHPDYPIDPVTRTPARPPEDLETGEFPARGNSKVLGRLTYLSEHDELYREHRPDYGDENGLAFDQHRGELSQLRAAMEEAGLRDEECELLVRYYGFQVDGKERVESLAHDFDVRKEADIYNRIRGISTKLAQTSWAAHL